ncbi:chemotaxis protein [Loktanella sp. 5RATIMAR09]|uniref:methyl-accepting chemotaxis protein n=1 Tax=Loktanella sp. 5RATIMAR09 TaxID=1225655 RepID=UPI00070748CB|nr:methyl-accepting chemotaxis protein [Loktanella sp. 5RATIMAR09]KQI73271.1 chemotaxis protein [Loktanella sp. 5RATIMAR09]
MGISTSIALSRKLPSIIAALCVAASVSIAIVGYIDFRQSVFQEARKNFQILTESRGKSLVTWFENTGQIVASYANDPTVVAALSSFDSSYNLMIDSVGLRDAYITNNPNPAGERALLDQAPESVPYHFQHGRFHPYFRDIVKTAGYYDFFLFNKNGDLMYSVEKAGDYATNFSDGPFADSGLASAFAAARDGAQGQVYFADFDRYAARAGDAAAFLATPVVDRSDQLLGVVAVQVPTSQIDAIFNDPLGMGETGRIYAVGSDLRTRNQPRFDAGPMRLSDVSNASQVRSIVNGADTFQGLTTGVSGDDMLTMGALVDVFGQSWAIIGEITTNEIQAPVIAARNKMIFVTVLVGGIAAFLGWLTAGSVVRPLARLGDAMGRISDKEYDVDLSDQKRGDEIGSLFNSLNDFCQKLRASDEAEEERKALQVKQAEVVNRLSIALTKLADGDLKHKIETPFDGDYDQLRQDYNRTMLNLNKTIGSVVIRSGAIRQRSDGMSRASDDLSRRTENQAATLEETAAALDQMTASVRSAADGARQVKEVVGSARQDADKSEPVVKDAVHAMTEIEGSSQEISQIIGVIDDIAFQTNLLALNAGVEAARAGEAGRGFAVVASEVRALAQRSSDAAKQIKALISESSGQVERGVALVGQAGQVLTKIASHINHISDLVAEIASGAEEQSIGLGEINIGVTQLDKVTQQNAAMVEEATASSHALNGDAAQLEELVTHFRLDEAAITDTSKEDNIMQFVPQPAQQAPELASYQARSAAKVSAGGGNREDIWQDF